MNLNDGSWKTFCHSLSNQQTALIDNTTKNGTDAPHNLCGVDDTYGGYAGCLLYAQHEIGTIAATNNEDEVSKALGPVAWARPDLRYVAYVL